MHTSVPRSSQSRMASGMLSRSSTMVSMTVRSAWQVGDAGQVVGSDVLVARGRLPEEAKRHAGPGRQLERRCEGSFGVRRAVEGDEDVDERCAQSPDGLLPSSNADGTERRRRRKGRSPWPCRSPSAEQGPVMSEHDAPLAWRRKGRTALALPHRRARGQRDDAALPHRPGAIRPAATGRPPCNALATWDQIGGRDHLEVLPPSSTTSPSNPTRIGGASAGSTPTWRRSRAMTMSTRWPR